MKLASNIPVVLAVVVLKILPFNSWSSARDWAVPLGKWYDPKMRRCQVLIGITIYTLFGFLVLPWIAKSQLEQSLAETFKSPVSIESLYINPYVLSVDVRQFSITELLAEETLISFERLYINFQLSSLFRWAYTFEALQLQGAHVNVHRFPDGHLNLSQLIPADNNKNNNENEEAAGIPRRIFHHLDVASASATFRDQTRLTEFYTEFGPIDIGVENLATLPDETGLQEVDIKLANGLNLAWEGSLTTQPIASSGNLEISGPLLPTVYQYLQDELNVEVEAGMTDVNVDYAVTMNTDEDLSLSISNISTTTRQLVITDKESGVNVINLAELALAGGEVAWPQASATIDSIELQGLNLNFWRTKEGKINLADVVRAGDQPVDAELADDSPPWKLILRKFTITDTVSLFEDRTLQNSGPLSIADFDAVFYNVTNTPGDTATTEMNLQFGAGGTLSARADITLLENFSAQAQLSGNDIALASFQHYLEDVMRVKLDKGTVSFQTNVELKDIENLSADGQVTIASHEVADALNNEPLLALDLFAIDRFEYQHQPAGLNISEVTIESPYISFLIAEDSTTNIEKLIVESNEGASTGGSPPRLTIGNINLTGGSSDFTDLSLPMPFATRIQGLEGEITTISSESDEPSRVDIKGQVGDWGLASISGSLKPLDISELADINVLFRNIDFSDLSPYTIKFAGRRIDNGRLEIDLGYMLNQGRIEGENTIIISELMLGEKVAHPDAMDLPLGLAVALLEGPDGTIDIDLPVRGDVNDPEFQIGGLVVKALVNLITGIVMSPFRLLGNLVGAGEDDFGTIQFEPGIAELLPPEKEKLAKLAEAMQIRPILSLSIAGVSNPVDTLALQTLRVDAQIEAETDRLRQETKERMWNELQRRGIELLYNRKFPGSDLAAKREEFTTQPTPESDDEVRFDEGAYLAALRNEIITAETLLPEDLTALANSRANSVLNALTVTGGLSDDRAMLTEAVTVDVNDRGWIPLKLEVTAKDTQ